MKIAVATIDQSHLAWNKDIGKKCLEITNWYTNYINHFIPELPKEQIFLDKSVDTVLEKAFQEGCQYCLIQFSGFFFAWSRYYEFLTGLLKRLKDNNPFFIGEIENKALVEQCFIVNLSLWNELKRPKYNPASWVALCQQKSIPLKSLDFSLKLLGHFLFPNDKESYYLNLPVFHSIVNQYKEVIYFYNDEGYDECQSKLPYLERFYSPGSGLKSNFILELNNFKENTVHVQFDCSLIQLEFKQAIIKEWDGEDYVSFCKWYSRYNSIHSLDLHGVSLYWEDFLKRFNRLAVSSFKEHWYRYKKINHKFVLSNICGAEQARLLNCINQNPNSAIWWDNIFHSMPTVFSLDFKGCEISYNNWLKQVYNKNPDIYLLSCKDSQMNQLPAKALKELHVQK